MESREQLAYEVRERAGDDPLERVRVALVLAGELAARCDDVIDEFVAAARQAGVSWTEIGVRLGVSKQAARQRFSDRLPVVGSADPAMGPVLRPRLLACLDRADQVALAEGADEVGSHHLLAGLLAEGVAAAILERLGVTADAIRASSARLFGPTGPVGDGAPERGDRRQLARSAEAAAAIESAIRVAQRNAAAVGCLEVGTEHLLIVLAFDPGSRARRVLVDLGTDIAAIKKELACYVPGEVSGPWRRRRRILPARAVT